MKIYTKTGDGGQTSLVGGERVFKDDPRVEAYGTVDELCAFTGHLHDLAAGLGERWAAPTLTELKAVTGKLMAVSAIFASGSGGKAGMPRITSADVESLERAIDRMSGELPPIRTFTLPCGHPLVSLCHICRTVCRRAERAAVRAARSAGAGERMDAGAMKYLNRLSDYLYTLSRSFTHSLGVTETRWLPND